MNALIIGKSGTGKTRSCQTLPGHKVGQIFDPGGERSIRLDLKQYDPGDGPVLVKETVELDETTVQFINYAALPTQIQSGYALSMRYLQKKRQIDLAIADANPIFDSPDINSIFVDGLTGMGQAVHAAVFQSGPKNTFEAWNQAMEKVLEYYEVGCGRYDKHFILLAHVQTEKDELEGTIKQEPLIFGKKLPGNLIRIFDTVFLSVYLDEKYMWVTRPTAQCDFLGTRMRDDLPEIIPQDFRLLLEG